MNQFKNRHVLIIGLGKSGIAAAQALQKLGAKVAVQDSKREADIDAQTLDFLKISHVECYFGKSPENPGAFDLYVLSPGVTPELPFIQEAKKAGVEIAGELEIAFRICPGNFVAITGTNGKTTTTTLSGEMFQNAGRKTFVVGNIGIAAISTVLEADEDSWMVTETSSFQLETIQYFKPKISVLLNLTPDHMDRHKTMENYARTKAKVYQNQDEHDYFIVNYDDPLAFDLSKDCKAKVVPFSRLSELEFGAYVKDETIMIRDEQKETTICAAGELKILGTHNLENALAASAMAYFAGIPSQVIAETLRAFAGVEHRMEFCGEKNGVRFVNDSKGTNPDASIKAINATAGDIILIAGGYDKNSDFELFIDAFDRKVRYMMLMGETAEKIKQAAEKKGFENSVILKDMGECVKEAFRLAKQGDTVLLSPACASWDMYASFEHRGEHFKKCVTGLGN